MVDSDFTELVDQKGGLRTKLRGKQLSQQSCLPTSKEAGNNIDHDQIERRRAHDGLEAIQANNAGSKGSIGRPARVSATGQS
jgi:hypothetical protein